MSRGALKAIDDTCCVFQPVEECASGGGGPGITSSSWLFGEGPSGDFTAVDATLAAAGYYQNYTVPAGVTVHTANYDLYVSQTATIDGTLHNDANPGAATQTAGTTTPAGSFGHANVAGGAGGTANGSIGTSVATAVGGAGGRGGNGSGGTGANGGTVTVPVATRGGIDATSVAAYAYYGYLTLSPAVGNGQFNYGAGGGGGGGDGTHGGGGGAGGCILKLAAAVVEVGATGVIRCAGGAGGSPPAGDRGGGGGGGGGVLLIFCYQLTNNGTISAPGGVGGTGSGTGANGNNGSDGIVRLFTGM